MYKNNTRVKKIYLSVSNEVVNLWMSWNFFLSFLRILVKCLEENRIRVWYPFMYARTYRTFGTIWSKTVSRRVRAWDEGWNGKCIFKRSTSVVYASTRKDNEFQQWDYQRIPLWLRWIKCVQTLTKRYHKKRGGDETTRRNVSIYLDKAKVHNCKSWSKRVWFESVSCFWNEEKVKRDATSSSLSFWCRQTCVCFYGWVILIANCIKTDLREKI